MSLRKHNKKREFKSPSEPGGTVTSSKGPLEFVVQKHAVLHYASPGVLRFKNR